MRIGIEAQRIFREHKHGMERVTIELIKNLQKIDKQNEYFIFVKPGIDSEVISKTSNFNIVEIPASIYPIWEQVQLPKYVKKYNCDILHCTSSTAPIFFKFSIITTIHDIIFLEENLSTQLTNKASILQKAGNIYRRLLIPFIIKKGKYFITVSNYEKQNIANYFDLKNKIIKVVYNGVSTIFNNDLGKKTDITNILSKDSKYFLHMANKDPRKNTERVLLAFSKYKNQSNNKVILVIVGFSKNELVGFLNRIKLNHLINEISCIKYVSDIDLSNLYKNAEIFLFPSLREGFGLPVLEAMACGVSLITSKTSSIPEIVDSSALLINPFSVNEIYNGIVKIQEDRKFKEFLINKGLMRSKQFSWETMAIEIYKLYELLYTETIVNKN